MSLKSIEIDKLLSVLYIIINNNNNNNNGYFLVLFLRRAHSPFNKKNKNNNGVNIELGKTQQIKSTVHDAN